jgi:hypothetical protein
MFSGNRMFITVFTKVAHFPHLDICKYRVGHKSLDTSNRFKCIFVNRLKAHPVLIQLLFLSWI